MESATIIGFTIDEFNNTQNIDISQIKCYKCKNKSKFDTFNHEFYICYDCNIIYVHYVNQYMIIHIKLLIMIIKIIYVINTMKYI